MYEFDTLRQPCLYWLDTLQRIIYRLRRNNVKALVTRSRFSLLLLAILCSSALPARAETAQTESRVTIPLQFGNPANGVGSITFSAGSGDMDALAMERPGDAMAWQGFGPGMWVGEGSEIRFKGTADIGIGVIAANDRLCFRKTKEGWAYVCGLGSFRDKKKEIEFGKNRTVDSCLALLSNPDLILREGAARDLGRMTRETDIARVVPKLSKLLTDSDMYVRRGAAEGLGLVHADSCIAPVWAAFSIEKDDITKQFMAQALAACAEKAPLVPPLAPELKGARAINSSVGKDWAGMEGLKNRITPEVATALVGMLASADAPERQVAAWLLGKGQSVQALEALKGLSDNDPDEKVKAEAKNALEKIPAK